MQIVISQSETEVDGPTQEILLSDQNDIVLSSQCNQTSAFDETMTCSIPFVAEVSGLPLRRQLQDSALKNNITHSSLDELLKILHNFHSELPLNRRTLLHTQVKQKVLQLKTGLYTHFDLLDGIKSRIDDTTPEIIHVDFNIDGLPLFRSTGTSTWPILCRSLDFTNKHPFHVGVFTGNKKPDPLNSYLTELLNDLKETEEFSIGSKSYKIVIRAFLCGAPARSFLKSCVAHNGRSGCEKCHVEGDYLHHRMIFLSRNAPLRTQDTFVTQSDEDHHLGVSPLTEIGIDCVKQFPLDPMHLLYLGVMKKLLLHWVCIGKPPGKLSGPNITKLSDLLVAYSSYIPQEFARKTRSLSEIRRYKATEFRLLLLCIGPVALLQVLPEQLYKHFLMLNVAITILSVDNYISDYFDLAKTLLSEFVNYFSCSYGQDMLVYNVHNLIHLADDVKNFGNLTTFDCFPFENFLGKLKSYVRSPARPHQQICRRLLELNEMYKSTKACEEETKFLKSHEEGPTPDNLEMPIKTQFKKCITPTFVLSVSAPDNILLLDN